MMAQQTGVARVIPKWRSFLERWPDPASCAAEDLAEVLVAWSGLGYPRRARNLHLAAAQMVERHQGSVPSGLDQLLALPGVGPYTASAVLAFAFERDVGVVDTNVARVLARWEGRPLSAAEARTLAQGQVPAGEGWWWNQSIMELGATVCGPRRPRCDDCPVRSGCAWSRRGTPNPDPAQGSALVSGRQTPFDGSDRQARGRLLAAVTAGVVAPDDLPGACGVPDDPARAERIVAGLEADGLVSRSADGTVSLPARRTRT